MAQSALDYIAMGNYPVESGYMLSGKGTLPAWPMKVVCDEMMTDHPNNNSNSTSLALLENLRDACPFTTTPRKPNSVLPSVTRHQTTIPKLPRISGVISIARKCSCPWKLPGAKMTCTGLLLGTKPTNSLLSRFVRRPTATIFRARNLRRT